VSGPSGVSPQFESFTSEILEIPQLNTNDLYVRVTRQKIENVLSAQRRLQALRFLPSRTQHCAMLRYIKPCLGHPYFTEMDARTLTHRTAGLGNSSA
jgi:hypothetical protein